MEPLNWEKVPAELVPDMEGWAAADGHMSFGISFDRRYPKLGYRGSWYDGTRAEFVDGAFSTLDSAKQALEEVRTKAAKVTRRGTA